MGEELRERVKERWHVAARSVLDGLGRLRAAGRRVSAASTRRRSGWTGQGRLFGRGAGRLPQAAGAASLGCGNPTALATLSGGGGLGPGQRWRHMLSRPGGSSLGRLRPGHD